MTEIKIGENGSEYKLTEEELKEAAKSSGFGKKLASNFASPAKISVVADPSDATITYTPQDAHTTGIELAKDAKEVTITVSKTGYTSSTYILYISRAEEDIYLRNLRIEGTSGDKKRALTQEELNKSITADGVDIKLLSSFPDTVKVVYDKAQSTDTVTTDPADVTNIQVSETKKTVTLTVENQGKTKKVVYKLNITKQKSAAPAEVKKITLTKKNNEGEQGETVDLLSENILQAKTTAGYTWHITAEPEAEITLTIEAKTGCVASFVEGATPVGTSGSKIEGKVKLPKDYTSATKVVIKVSGTDLTETTYTINFKLD